MNLIIILIIKLVLKKEKSFFKDKGFNLNTLSINYTYV